MQIVTRHNSSKQGHVTHTATKSKSMIKGPTTRVCVPLENSRQQAFAWISFWVRQPTSRKSSTSTAGGIARERETAGLPQIALSTTKQQNGQRMAAHQVEVKCPHAYFFWSYFSQAAPPETRERSYHRNLANHVAKSTRTGQEPGEIEPLPIPKPRARTVGYI